MSIKYQKLALVEARVWSPSNPDDVTQWLDGHGIKWAVLDGDRLGIGTLESLGAKDELDAHAAKPGDLVIKGGPTDFYAHDRDLFIDERYQAVQVEIIDGKEIIIKVVPFPFL